MRSTIFLLALALSLHADVEKGVSYSATEATLTAFIGNLTDSATPADAGTVISALGGVENLDATSPDGSLQAVVTLNTLAVMSVRPHGTTYLQVLGSVSSKNTAAASGNWTPNPALPVTVTENVESALRQRFNIITSAEPVTLDGLIGANATGAVSIERQQGLDNWVVVFSVDDTTVAPDRRFSFTQTLAPGEYRVTATLTRSGLLAPGATDRTISFALDVGTAQDPAPVTAEGSHTHPKVGTILVDSPDLTVINPVILSETPVGGGLTEMLVTAQLQNDSACPWNNVELTLRPTFPGGPEIQTLPTNDTIRFSGIPAEDDAAPDASSATIQLRVPNAGAAALRASILDGSRFTTRGCELWVFRYPVDLITPTRAEFLLNNWLPGISPRAFDNPIISPYTILLEHEEEFAFALVRESLANSGLINSGFGGRFSQHPFELELPMLIGEVVEAERVTEFGGVDRYYTALPLTLYDGEGEAIDEPYTLLHLVKHGTIRSTVDATSPSGFGVNAGIEGNPVTTPHPVHFNRVRIGDAIDLSGSLFFKPRSFDVEIQINEFSVRKFLVTTRFDAETTLLVETRGAADNQSAPLTEQEEQLFSVPLFSLYLPSGLTFTSNLSLSLGAAVNAPDSLSVPVQSSLSFTATAGYIDGQPFYDQDVETTPPTVSAPAIFSQLDASVSAWAKLELFCALGGGGFSGGPTIGARLGGEFELTPAGDPWWKLDGALDVTGGVEFAFLGLDFVDEETTLATLPIFSIDAGGPLLPPGPAARNITLPDNPGLRPIGGRDTRWARALAFFDTPDDPGRQFIVPLAGSTDLIVGGGRDLSRYSAEGELKWTLLNSVPLMKDAIAHPDGGFVTLSTEGFAIARHDGDGVRQWVAQRIAPSGEGIPFTQIVIGDLVARPASVPGQLEYFTGGFYGIDSSPRQPFLVKCDDSGNILWIKRYAADLVAGVEPYVETLRLATTAAGDVILSGQIDPSLASPGLGFIMKVDGDSGEPLWATALNSGPRSSILGPVAEDDEGNLCAGGNWGANVLDKLPQQLLAKFSASGESLGGILYGSIDAEGAGDAIAPTRPIPTGGETVFDVMRDLTWHDGHLWGCGQIGVGTFVLGLSSGQAGYTLRVSRDLEIDRFALHTGTGAETLAAIRPAADGILTSGNTRSILPWPGGHDPQGGFQPQNVNARLVMKLPMEGLLRFHDLSNAAQSDIDDPNPATGSHYIYPRVFSLADVGAFSGGSLSFNFTAHDLTLAPPFFAPGTLAAATPQEHYQIEFVPKEIIGSWQDHLKWHQLDADEDSDNDGLDLATEFYHGTDPFAPNSIALQMTTHPLTGAPTLSFSRSDLAAAEGWAAPIEKSGTLEDWDPVPSENLDVFPNSSGELLYLNPFILPGQQKQFYRLTPAYAP